MINIKIFFNYYTNQNRVVVKNVDNEVLVDDYCDNLGNLKITLNRGCYKLFFYPSKSSCVLYRDFFYDGMVKEIVINFNNKSSLRKILLLDRFYHFPILKGVVKLWPDLIQ